MTKIRVGLPKGHSEEIELNIPVLQIKVSDIREEIGSDKRIFGWTLVKEKEK